MLPQWRAGSDHDTLAALSSLFTHLVKFGVVEQNPVREVERPTVNRREEMPLAFSQKQTRRILDAPAEETVHRLREVVYLTATDNSDRSNPLSLV